MAEDHGVGWGVFVWGAIMFVFWMVIVTKILGLW